MGADPIRILILTASFGEGHNQAAKAIQEGIEEVDPSAQVRVLDYMNWAHPKLDSFAQYCLYQSCRKAPSLYGYLYKATDRVSANSPMNRPLQRVGRSRLLQYLQEYDPLWVVSTFPISASVVSRMREIGKVTYRTATVITDLHPHSQWIHPCTDRYFVASEQVAHILRRRGVARTSISVTGIPVRKQFSHSIMGTRADLKRLLGLHPDRPMVLVTGGGAGIFPDLEDCIEAFAKQFAELQVVVVCGRNESLRAQLDILSWAAGWKNVHIKGFLDNIHDYMAAADLVIGKSGGMTTAESLAVGTPMMIYRPLPGQETYNARHLVRSGAALLAMNPNEMVSHLHRLSEDPELLHSLRSQAARLGRGTAARQIAEQLLAERSMPDAIKVSITSSDLYSQLPTAATPVKQV